MLGWVSVGMGVVAFHEALDEGVVGVVHPCVGHEVGLN